MTSLRIMSNNIWWCDTNRPEWEAKGEDCSAAHRAPGLIRVYEETKPDIIGLQECSARMAHFLMSEMAEKQMPYALLWGRNTPIAYRKDKFELIDSDVCIYPEEVPGLEGSFNDLKTKSYCIAVLRQKDTDQKLIFATTHLWYKSDARQPFSEAAKAWQIGQLINRLDTLQEQYLCPAIIVGDLNTWPTAPAVRTALERGFVHGHDAATEYADDSTGMHYCYGDGWNDTFREGGFGCSIDHILIRGAQNWNIRRFERYCPEYYLPLSDHSPVWIDVEI